MILGSYLEERFGETPKIRRFFNWVKATRHHRVTIAWPVWTIFFHGRRYNRWSVRHRDGKILDEEPAWRRWSYIIFTRGIMIRHLFKDLPFKSVPEAKQSGIYLLLKETTVVYVGMSENVSTRCGSHCGSEKDFDESCFIPMKVKHLREAEHCLIAHFKPKYNYNSLGQLDNGYIMLPPGDPLVRFMRLKDK